MQKKQKLQKAEKKPYVYDSPNFFRPNHKHVSSLFLFESPLYDLESGLPREDMNQWMAEHKWGHMWGWRTVSMAKFMCVRAGTGPHAEVVATDTYVLFQVLHLANELHNIPPEIGCSQVFNKWLVI